MTTQVYKKLGHLQSLLYNVHRNVAHFFNEINFTHSHIFQLNSCKISVYHGRVRVSNRKREKACSTNRIGNLNTKMVQILRRPISWLRALMSN